MGKSKTVTDFLSEWKAAGFNPVGGVLICLSRLQEIDAYIERAGLSPDDYAVLSPDKDYRDLGLGATAANKAKVLFVTHQMVRSRLSGRGAISYDTFEGASCFYFDGRPRATRIWDENFDPAQRLMFKVDGLLRLFGPLRSTYPDFVERLQGLVDEARQGGIGMVVQVPADLDVPSIAYGEGGGRNPLALTKDELETLSDLMLAKGQTLRLEQSYRHEALVGAARPLPKDLAPLIVLDASARLREVYRLWQLADPDHVHCYSPAKADYRDLTIRHWPVAAGRQVLTDRNKRDDLLSAAAEAINGRNEDWLVIGPKDDGLEADLKRRLIRAGAVTYLHWGAHLASNNYRHIRNVVVLGFLLYPPATYSAMVKAACLGSSAVRATADLGIMGLHEAAHHLMQAVGRSNVRQVENGIAGNAEVFVIGKNPVGLADMFDTIFPGCMVIPWQPGPIRYRGATARVVAVFDKHFAIPGAEPITKVAVTIAAKLKSTDALAKIIKHKLAGYMAANGIGKDRRTFFKV